MGIHHIFTDDLMEDILLRLPVRHLLRFRCVSKSWCALIDSPSFIEKHHQIQSAISQEEGDAPLFLIRQSLDYGEDPAEFYLLSKKLGDEVLCLTPDLDRDRVPNDDPNQFNGLRCIGVVNGVVGLCWGDKYLELGLWNPATRDFKVIPLPRPTNPDDDRVQFGPDIIGLGFDPKSSDFKIVRSDDFDHLCMIYSLSTNSWTRLDLPLSYHPINWMNISRTNEYNNGVCYWTATVHYKEYKFLCFVILSFDFSTEAFRIFDPPHAVVRAATNTTNYLDWMVGQYMECLALIFARRNSGEALFSYEIWIASKINVSDGSKISLSWQHLFTIEPLDGMIVNAFVAFRVDGDVLLNIYRGGRIECNLYNPSTRTLKNLGLSCRSGHRYVESLFPLSKRANSKLQRVEQVEAQAHVHENIGHLLVRGP